MLPCAAICHAPMNDVCSQARGGRMEPIIRTNTKARVNLTCPQCGMNLKKAPQGGFVKYGDTFCCLGCAEGTGCTCNATTRVKKSFSRPGDIGWRNAENTARDRNDNKEVDTSSKPIGKREADIPPRYQSRDQRQWDPRSRSEEHTSELQSP